MVEFDCFGFAAPPCTGSRWFVDTLRKIGVVAAVGNSRRPPLPGHTGFVLSIVRHPVDWLLSYFNQCQQCRYLVPEVDVFQDDLRGAKNFEDFVDIYLYRHAGQVSKMFDSYRPSSVMKFEDLPWCAIEFLQSIGHTHGMEELKKRPPEAPCGYHKNRELVRSIIKAEREFCDRLEYF